MRDYNPVKVLSTIQKEVLLNKETREKRVYHVGQIYHAAVLEILMSLRC